ncbi:hypothetical protein HMPREF9996_00126 [Aggregatibacter actinomycetemcomitans Y4]|nr:hypothetical protein HMPREF9996_00126 [Aggregatibacter actinomycetemcomitans Y4]
MNFTAMLYALKYNVSRIYAIKKPHFDCSKVWSVLQTILFNN